MELDILIQIKIFELEERIKQLSPLEKVAFMNAINYLKQLGGKNARNIKRIRN